MGPIRNRAKLWPAAISAQVSTEIKDALRDEAERQGLKEADVIRQWLDAGYRWSKRSRHVAVPRTHNEED